jgi:hypothetical protein
MPILDENGRVPAGLEGLAYLLACPDESLSWSIG